MALWDNEALGFGVWTWTTRIRRRRQATQMGAWLR